MTPYEVAEYLGIEGATQPTDSSETLFWRRPSVQQETYLRLTSRCPENWICCIRSAWPAHRGSGYWYRHYRLYLRCVVYIGSTYVKKSELEQTETFRKKHWSRCAPRLKNQSGCRKNRDLSISTRDAEGQAEPSSFYEKISGIVKRPIEVKRSHGL